MEINFKEIKLAAVAAAIISAGAIYADAVTVGSRNSTAAITLNPAEDTGAVNKLVFGNNQLGFDGDGNRGCGIWDPAAKRPVPEMVKLAMEAGITVARYPGGCDGHNYSWKSCIGPVEKRQNQKFGLPEFLMFCEKTGEIPVITVAEYFGTAQDAADLVEYCNAPDDGKHPYAAMRAADGHPQPYGVVWFEYGNESYHGNHGGAEKPVKFKIFTPEEYGRNYLEYQKAMKAVDNKIRLGVVLNSADLIGSEWDEKALKIGGRNIDFVIPHIYTPYYSSNDGKPDAKTLFTIALAGPNWIPFIIKRWKEQIKSHTGIDNMPFAVTEFNSNFVQNKPVPYRLCLGTALIVAEHLRFYMHEPSVAIANYWQFSNSYFGMVKGYSEPYTKRPAYWVFWLYSHYFGDTLIDAAVDCPSYDSPGGFKMPPAFGKPAEYTFFPENILPQQNWNVQKAQWLNQQEADGVLIATVNSDKKENYYHADKRMAASPLTGYQVSAEVRVEGLGTTIPAAGWLGAGIQVGDGRGYASTKSLKISNMAKSSDWTKVLAEYITLPDAKNIVIQARCMDTKGQPGKIYVRNVQVRRFIPDNSGSVPYLGVNASKSKDGKSIYVMIVNKHLSDDIQTAINGVSAKSAEAYCLSGPSVDAVNEQNPDNVKVNQLPVKINGQSVEITLPKHSMTAVVIRL